MEYGKGSINHIMTAAIRTLTIALILCLSILTMIVLEYHPNIKGKHEITRFVVTHKQKRGFIRNKTEENLKVKLTDNLQK
jgi:hypothetical protein